MMDRPRGSRRCHDRRLRAFSLIEVTIAAVIVAVMLVAALNTTGAVRVGQYQAIDESRGQGLAQDLMTEILRQAYEDPTDPKFGRESGESKNPRSDYDDVDDYDGWSASPPEYRDGTSLVGVDNWTRSVTVEFVVINDVAGSASGSDTGVKRITVTVKRGNVSVASLVAVRVGDVLASDAS
ncbi:MAG: prepilin-type N-terminal cleavage/methylation domain-containing protein [Phycisphaerae bacterium]